MRTKGSKIIHGEIRLVKSDESILTLQSLHTANRTISIPDTDGTILLDEDLGALAQLDTIGTNQIDDAAVTNSKQANMPVNTIKARMGSGGSPQNLNPNQIRNILNVNQGGEANLDGAKSITIQSGAYELVNDQESPTASHYYGTNSEGNRGWFVLPEIEGAVTGSITHEQAAASQTWTVTHNLSTSSPLVQVYMTDNEAVFPETINIIDSNSLEIVFGDEVGAITGRARIIGASESIDLEQLRDVPDYENNALKFLRVTAEEDGVEWVEVHNEFDNVGNLGGTQTFDFNVNPNFRGVLNEDVAITISNLDNGQNGLIALYFDLSTQRTISWSGVDFWADGEPTSGPANQDELLVVNIVNDGENIIGTVVEFGESFQNTLNFTDLQNNDLIQYDAVNEEWKNIPPSDLGFLEAANAVLLGDLDANNNDLVDVKELIFHDSSDNTVSWNVTENAANGRLVFRENAENPTFELSGKNVNIPNGNLNYSTTNSEFSDQGNLGASHTFGFNDQTNYRGVLNENVTITISNLSNGQSGFIGLYYDNTAQREITWSGVDFWSGAEPVLGPEANDEILTVFLINDGGNVIGFVAEIGEQFQDTVEIDEAQNGQVLKFNTAEEKFQNEHEIRRISVNDTDHTVASDHKNHVIIAVTALSDTRSIILPSAANYNIPYLITIKDESGDAGTHTIVVQADPGEGIDGIANLDIKVNHGALKVYSNGSAWFTSP